MRPILPILLVSLTVPVVAGRAFAGAGAPNAPSALDGDEPPPDEPPPPPDEPPPDKDAGKVKAEFPPCIEVKAYARHNATGFDHVVSIANGCEKDANCQVTTDVSPDLVAVGVPANETRDVVTFRGSPTYEFQARVKCDLEE